MERLQPWCPGRSVGITKLRLRTLSYIRTMLDMCEMFTEVKQGKMFEPQESEEV